MASKYWVAGGTGNVNSTTNWSDTDGGVSGAALPGAGDDALFNGNSGTGTVTLNANFTVHSFDTTASGARTITGAGTLTVGGQATLTTAAVLKLVSNITWTANGAISIDNRSGGTTITTSGVAMTTGTTNVIGPASTNTAAVTFADGMNTGQPVTLNGTGNVTLTSAKTLTCKALAFGASNTLTLTYSGATINCINPTAPLTAQANITWTGNSSSQLNLTAWQASTATFSTCSYPGTTTLTVGAAPSGLTVSGGATFVNLTINGSAQSQTSSQIALPAGITVSGILTIAGASQRQRLWVVGTTVLPSQRTVTVNGSVALSNTDFCMIKSAGTAGTWTGTNLGNGQACTGITFTSPATVYWVGGTSGNFGDVNKWATGSGGSAGSAGCPLPQDTAVFDATSVSSGSVTITNDCLFFPVLNTSAVVASAFTIQSTSIVPTMVTGSITLSSTTTLSTTGATGHNVYNDSGTITITQNGGSFSVAAPAAGSVKGWNVYSSVTVSGASIFTGMNLILNAGTWDFSSGNVTIYSIYLAINGPILALGEYFYTITANVLSVGQGFRVSPAGSAAKVPGLNTASIIITNTLSAAACQLDPCTSLAIGTVTITGAGGATIGTTGSINTLALSPGITVTCQISTTLTLLQLEAIGKSGSLITLNSSTAGSAHTFSVVAGIINLDWCSIKDTTVSGGAIFYTGPNSTYSTGNTGWSGTPPTSGPARQQLSLAGCGGY